MSERDELRLVWDCFFEEDYPPAGSMSEDWFKDANARLIAAGFRRIPDDCVVVVECGHCSGYGVLIQLAGGNEISGTNECPSCGGSGLSNRTLASGGSYPKPLDGIVGEKVAALANQSGGTDHE